MNKNIIKLFAILVMCFIFVGVLVACGSKGEETNKPEDCICSDACDCRDFEGLQGLRGENGADGLTPHIGENGNWYIGETDTGVPAKAESLADCENHDWDMEPLRAHSYDPTTGALSTGVNILICKDCGDAAFERIPHEYTSVVTAPTCTAVGYTTYTCSCGHSYVADETAKVPHTYNAVVTAPTCLSKGYTTYTCTECGDSYVADETEFAAHVWGAWEDTLKPDDICECEWKRPQVRHCTVCGVEDTHANELGAIGHSFTDYKPAVRPDHIPVCEWAEMDIAECDNCDCFDCLDKIKKSEAPGHVWGAWTMVKVPTETEEGLLVRECTVCGKTDHDDAKHTLPVFSKDTYASETKKASTCCEEGVKSYYIVVDGQKFEVATESIEKLNHVFDANSVVAIDPVPGTNEGVAVVKCNCDCCNECPATHTEVLPALSSGEYTLVTKGNCFAPFDYYTYTFTVDGNEITINFSVDGGYVHDEAPAQSELEMVEGEDKFYWVYKCTKCGFWIVDHFVYK